MVTAMVTARHSDTSTMASTSSYSATSSYTSIMVSSMDLAATEAWMAPEARAGCRSASWNTATVWEGSVREKRTGRWERSKGVKRAPGSRRRHCSMLSAQC